MPEDIRPFETTEGLVMICYTVWLFGNTSVGSVDNFVDILSANRVIFTFKSGKTRFK